MVCPACTTRITFAIPTMADAELLTYLCPTHDLTDLHGVKEMEQKAVKLQVENECLKRTGTLHMRRCLLLEDICYKNGLHVPGGLVAQRE